MHVVFRIWQHDTTLKRELVEGDVHLWLVELDATPSPSVATAAYLSNAEREQCERLRTPQLQQRFVARRTALRCLLGSYLGVPPQAVQYLHNRYGKPQVMQTGTRDRLFFNLSHSQDVALVGLTCVGEIGVDIEKVVPIPDMALLVDQWFFPLEKEQFDQLAGKAQTRAFYNGWTRKEAFVKAVGQGISYPLYSFSVRLKPYEPTRLLHSDAHIAHEVTVLDVPARNGYAAACVVLEESL